MGMSWIAHVFYVRGDSNEDKQTTEEQFVISL